MSLKTKALIETVGMIAMAAVVGALINLIMTTVSTQVILNALALGTGAWVVWIFYSIRLTALQYEEKLKEITGNKKVAE